MIVPTRAFIDGSEPREERRRSTLVTHQTSLPEGPTVSWAIAGVVIALLAIVCALVALL